MAGIVQEVLKSNDVDLIKRTRTAYKGKLTRASNILVEELIKDENGKFKFYEINSEEVTSLLSNLNKVKDIVEELHVCYTVKRIHKEGPEEVILEEADNEYAGFLEKTHHDAVKVYYAYSTQLKVYEQSRRSQEDLSSRYAQYPDKLRSFKAKVSEYECAHNEASLVVASDDEYLLRTASMQKNMLIKEYTELLEMGQELLAIVPNISEVDPSDKEQFELRQEKLTYRKTLTSLERAIKRFEFEDKLKLAKAAPAPTVYGDATSTVVSDPVNARDSKVLKIKVSAPKFSGKSRDFAVFKRDFQSIVAVENRSAVEIGVLLKESIPTSYRYLLDKFDLADHKK